MHRRGRREAHGLADVAHRGRIAVARGVALDEVEDLLLALRQILPNVHALRGLLNGSNVCSHKVPTPPDGLNPHGAGYTRHRPRADGGIGRRARLRAWSGITGWRFESSSAHCTKAPLSRGFRRSRPVPFRRGPTLRDNASGNWRTARVLQCSPTQEAAMSAHYDRSRDRWIVRWRENGRQRARRFGAESEAREFEAAVFPSRTAPAIEGPASLTARVGGDRAGVYAYETTEG